VNTVPFNDGSKVVHGLTSSEWTGRISAWFDKDNNLVDAEKFDVAKRATPVKKNSKLWLKIEKVSKSHV